MIDRNRIVNVLDPSISVASAASCDRNNHFDCLHRDEDHLLPSNFLTYLDGWTTVAAIIAVSDDAADGTYLDETIRYFEQHGARDSHDLGVRDALLAAFGAGN